LRVRDQIADVIEDATAEPDKFHVWMKLDDGSEHQMCIAAMSPGDAVTTLGDLLRKQRGVENVGISDARITRVKP